MVFLKIDGTPPELLNLLSRAEEKQLVVLWEVVRVLVPRGVERRGSWV
jgi:hypothetical protein